MRTRMFGGVGQVQVVPMIGEQGHESSVQKRALCGPYQIFLSVERLLEMALRKRIVVDRPFAL